MPYTKLSVPYADYVYYKDTYLGTVFQEEKAFASCARMASRLIDQQTFHRIPGIDPADYTDDLVGSIRDCACALAEEVARYRNREDTFFTSTGIAAESNDGYYISYAKDPQAETGNTDWDINVRSRRLVGLYLSWTGLGHCAAGIRRN